MFADTARVINVRIIIIEQVLHPLIRVCLPVAAERWRYEVAVAWRYAHRNVRGTVVAHAGVVPAVTGDVAVPVAVPRDRMCRRRPRRPRRR